ncbi:hypothetical protein [Brevibacterium moorei]|uniref:hypothetical protein n=1 Tax=Brevibacterium moorei TaxID=2968457 RepID=UPI00211C1ACB|nr:hypothetical protein [Brevibacterium sp. 68QC2CO]MCQ9386075.1 hypothetical protein [Brevibacterium sp. 68QC2CO]
MRLTTRTTMTTLAAIASVCLALALTACGGSGGGSTAKTPGASPTAEFNPKLTMQSETLKYGDKSTVTVDAQVPKVTGVESSIADGYTKAFKADLMKELKKNSISIESGISGGSEEQCDEHTKGKCITHARFKQHDAQIYKDYATVSYELGITPFGAHPETTVKSLTVNLRTGKPAQPSDFINTSDPDLASAIKKGKCLENYDEDPASANGFEAFSPTDSGFNATWSAGAHSFDACGIGDVTLPWSDFGKEKPSGSPNAGIQEPSDSPKAAGNSCAGNPKLPEGAAPEGCVTRPKGAKQLPTESLIMTPTKNIWCSASAEVLDCSMINPQVRIDLNPTGKAFKPNRDDGPAAQQPVTLAHGTSATIGDYACSSAKKGLTCWSIHSKHGLFLSKAKQVLW